MGNVRLRAGVARTEQRMERVRHLPEEPAAGFAGESCGGRVAGVALFILVVVHCRLVESGGGCMAMRWVFVPGIGAANFLKSIILFLENRSQKLI